jgi:glycosyltransferase involved in cell wall biosynthesis
VYFTGLQVTYEYPKKVVITGGKPAGGVESFAEALRAGFAELGIPAEVVPPRSMFARVRELRDPAVLKVLSTTAVFAAPLARRCICMAHGFPRADVQGWLRLAGIVTSFKLGSQSGSLVAVSEYAATHLRSIFDLRIDAVIHNPLQQMFLQKSEVTVVRDCITYIGRLHPAKNLDRILPAIQSLLDEAPDLCACIAGDGPLRAVVEKVAANDARVQYCGSLSPRQVREQLQRTRVFVSGCETEALGIAYLEALSQGCNVAMPACGGGLEIAPELIGESIYLLPLPLAPGSILPVLRRALHAPSERVSLDGYSCARIAAQYLELDHRRQSAQPSYRQAAEWK